MKKLFTFLFVLLAAAFTVQAQIDDFEMGMDDWTVTSADANVGSWMHGTNTTLSSQYFNPPAHTQFIAVNDDAPGANNNTSGTIMYNNPIDLAGFSAPVLAFSAYFIDGDYGGDEVASVLVSNDGGTTWNTVFDVPGDGAWADYSAPLFDYVGQSVMIAFDYDDGNSWNYGFCVDDVSVADYPITFGVRLDNITVGCGTAKVGVETEVSGNFSNEGVETITSLDINWSDGTDTYTETLTGLNVELFESYNFVHTSPITIPDGSASMDFWISNPNGMADPNTDDNMTSFSVQGIHPTEGRGIYVEEATGTWCTWCPRGAVWMDRMSHCFGEHFVGVAVHNQDPMENDAWDTGLTNHPDFTGFPSVLVDRDDIMDPSALEGPTVSTIQTDVVAMLSHFATYDDATGDLIVEASATMMEDITQAGYRLNVMITEDGVTGTSSGYDQVNAYSGGNFGPMGGYENLPSPVPASMMVYDHVGRALLGGYNGVAGSMPDTMVSGETYTYTMDTYNVSVNWDTDNLHILTVLTDNTGSVVNAHSTTLAEATFVGVRPTVNNDIQVNVFPNPMQDVTNIRVNLESRSDVTLRVFNSMGQLVASRDYGSLSGDMILPFVAGDLANGMYQLTLQVNDQIVTKTVMVSK